MELSKFWHGFVKVFHEFVKFVYVFLSLCQRKPWWGLTKISKVVEAFAFDWVQALKPWVRCFGDTLYLTLPHRLEVRLALWARLAKLVAQLSFIDIQNSDLLSLAWGLHFLHLKLTLRLSSFITFMTGCGLKPWSKLAHLCWHILSVFKWNSFSSWFDCPAACILDECSLISLDKRDDQPVNSCLGKKTQKMQIQRTDLSSFFNLSFSGSRFPFTCENQAGPATNSKEFRKGMHFWGPGGIPQWGREPGWRSAASLSCPCSSLLSQPCHLDRIMLEVRQMQTLPVLLTSTKSTTSSFSTLNSSHTTKLCRVSCSLRRWRRISGLADAACESWSN